MKRNKQRKEVYPVKMVRIMRFSCIFAVAMLIIIFSPFQSSQFSYRKASVFRNAPDCSSSTDRTKFEKIEYSKFVHVAMTLDNQYLRGSIAAVHSILRHSKCPENVFFHFLVSDTNLKTLIQYIFPELKFNVYYFDSKRVKTLISTSVREALEHPLNYARNYLADLLEPSIHRVIYLDSDIIVIDDIFKLWSTNLGGKAIGAPEYCHANFTTYFTARFLSDMRFSGVFAGRKRKPCYFNTGVMVMDLVKWRRVGYTKLIEEWMDIQKTNRIYELGSLPPFLLVFAGDVAHVDHRWNQHGLGGDNVKGSCRKPHPGPTSLLHWSGSGKPWVRFDSKKACAIDFVWASYDLYKHET
nr:PREDICTED: probable galacturonosyltransferase-like 7 [Nicotiana tabacum]